jgi:hypothetical protein
MLRDLELQAHAGPTFRLANARDDVAAARELGIAEHEIAALLDFLRRRVGRGALSEVLDNAFRPRAPAPRPYGHPQRFHDGTWPCLYTALEPETARAEVTYHASKSFGGTRGTPLAVYYHLLRMDFDGRVFDIREREGDWPDLAGPNEESYPFCHRLAASARAEGADGLLTPSARRREGTCLPVLDRRSVDNVRALEVERISVA